MAAQDNSELVEELRADLARVTDRMAANREALEQLGDMAAEVTSADGTVTVRAAQHGLVSEVRLGEAAMSSDAETLSATITTAVRQAVACAAGESRAVTPEPASSRGGHERDDRTGGSADSDDDGPVFTGLGSG